MKVAVAGGLGFLGSNVVSRLEERGHESLPFSRRTGVDIRSFDQINNFLRKGGHEMRRLHFLAYLDERGDERLSLEGS